MAGRQQHAARLEAAQAGVAGDEQQLALGQPIERRDRAQREQAIASSVARYAARLEAMCREHPYNWFNFHDFWVEDSR